MSKEEIDSILGIQQNSDVSSPKTPKKEVPKVQKVEKTHEKVPFVGNTHASMDSLNKQITESINTNKLHKKQREDEKINSRLSANELRDKQRAEQAQVQAAKVREHALAADKEKSEKNFTLSNDMIGRGGIRDGMTRKDIEALQQAKSIYQMEQDIASTENSIKKQNESLNPFAQKPLIYDIANGIRNNGIVKKEKEISQIKSDLAQGINTPEEHMEVWIKPEYKLSKSEEKKAEKIVSDYDKYMLTKPNISLYPEEFTEEEREYDKKVGHLRSKVYGSQAVQTGYLETMPFYESSLADSEDYQKDKDNIMTQNPAGYYGGMVVGELLKYGLGSKAMQAIPAVGKLTGSAGKGVAKLVGGGDKLAQSAANVMGDTMLDVALDTVPSAVRDAKNGVEGSKVATNALKNLGLNMAFNVGGELLGAGLDSIGKRKVPKQTNADTIPVLNDLETPVIESNVKSALNNSNTIETPNAQAVDNISINNTNDFMKQVNDSVTGKIKPQQAIIVGNTPNKLKEYGASDLKMTMSQSDIAKIAYPKGYMGGKHNLGFYAIEQIPNQLENPLAILKSSTQKNSLIVVTELIDESGYPAIIPIHLSKNGNIGLSNEVASMYGKGNWDKWIENQRKTGKLLFENKERALSELPRTGLQLSGLVAQSDPIFNYSVPKTAQNVNKSANPILDNAEYDVLEDIVKNSATPTVDYRKVKIDGMDDYNKEIDKMVGMYGTNTTKQLAVDLKESLNEVIKTNSEDVWEKFMKNVGEFNDSMKGRSYTYKRKGPKMQAHYENNANEIFLSYVDDIAERARKATANTTVQNASQQAKTMAANIERPNFVDNIIEQGRTGEIPVKKDEAIAKVSKSRTNTLANSQINTNKELQSDYLNEGKFLYEEIGEKETVANALKRVNTDSKQWKNTLMSQDDFTATDVDTMMMIYRDTVQRARTTGSDDLWKEASDIFKKIQTTGTKNGQAIQAFAKWSRNTPEGVFADTMRQVRETLKKSMSAPKVDALLDTLSAKTQNDILNYAEIALKNGLDSRVGKEAYAKIGKIINQNTPKTITGVIKSYLMDSMLLNFRTLISRNAGGNLGYNAMEFARQPVTAGIDKLVSLGTKQRTRTGWSIGKMRSAVEGMAKGISDEAQDIAKGLHTAKTGENTIENAIYLNSHAFKGNNPVSRVANKVDDLVKHGLSVGDRPFYESAYKQRMTELTDLRNKGLLGKDVMKLSDDKFAEYASLAAKLDGLTATYQDDGAMAKALTSLKGAVGDLSKGSVGADVLSQLVMPFTRTPGNIITKSLEYSPLGVVKNAVTTGNEIKRGKFNQRRFVDETGRNLLGGGLFAGGVAAYDAGKITGSYSDDKDMKNAQKNSGMQEYALNTGNGNFDISWLPVVGSDITSAAAFKEAYDKNKENLPEAITKGTLAGADALLNTSTLQGMNRMFGGNTSYSTEDNLLENAGNALTSGFGQAVPSLARQIAQVQDPYERTLSDGDRPYWQNSLINSIPGLREELQPKIDNHGNIIEQNQGRGTASKILENMFSPGRYTEIKDNPVNEESMRLFESTGNNYSFLPTANRNDIETDDFIPNDEQFAEYQKDIGKLNSEMAGDLIKSSYYQSLSDEGKEKALQDIYSGMKAVAKEEHKPDYSSDDKIASAYKESGTKGVIEYMQKKHDFDVAGVSESEDANAIYEKEGLKGIKEYAEYKNVLKDYGISDSTKVASIYKEGGVPYLEKYSAIKTEADSNNNDSISKKEIMSYLDGTNMSQSQKRLWFSYIMAKNVKNPY